jgi:two-component system KDP operon response regulator KdpE
MNTTAEILVIEDDERLSHVFSVTLEAFGYRILAAQSGQQALEEVRTRNPEIILLDLGLPDGDGLALIPRLRQHTAAPIIVVSAREREDDKVRALDAGANDYLTKPFSVPELGARIRAALRSGMMVTTGGSRTAPTVLSFGEFRLDLESRRLLRSQQPVSLSLTEVRLLASLARHANQVVTTARLLKETWGGAYQRKAAYVRVYMHALRRKIEVDPAHPRYLLNEIGLGYRLRTSGDDPR